MPLDRPIVALDTETATLRGAPHLLELGAVRVVDGEIAGEFCALVRPEVAIEAEASAFHGIRDEDVRDAEPAGAVLARFAEWVAEDWMVAHAAEADAHVLGFEYARARLAPPPGPLLCTVKIARKRFPEAPDHKLDTLCELLGLDEGPRHRALPDAVWCWKVLEACLERGADGTAAGLLALAGRPLTIAGLMPRARLKQRLRPLERACAEGREVTLLYGDEQEAPARLPVRPRVLYEQGTKGYLEAECRLSGTLKTYRLDRVQRVL
jgi:DNA polymerase III epsilon subunit-like protein